MKLAAVVWGSELPMLTEAAGKTGTSLAAFATFRLREQETLEKCLDTLREADAIILHPTNDAYWDTLAADLTASVPVISFGQDQAFWSLSTVPVSVIATVNAFFTYGGPENMENLLLFIRGKVLGEEVTAGPPVPGLWEGAYHPDAPGPFRSAEEYWSWRGRTGRHTVGILFYRIYWANQDLMAIDALIRELEEDMDVIAVFSIGSGDTEAGAADATDVIRRFFSGTVDAIVCLQSSALSHDPEKPVEIFRELDVPVFHPLVLYYRTEQEWLESSDGLSSTEMGWAVVLPEMYGMVEMLPLASAMREGPGGPEHAWHRPIGERVRTIANRVRSWVRLREIPNEKRRVAFILNSSPCASVEANVGAAAHLDALESVARILAALRDRGYRVDAPASGKELAEAFLGSRAISEFRWTSVKDIIDRGGALGSVDLSTYQPWFDELDPHLHEMMRKTWGEPPGEERNGTPPAMVHNGQIIITGLSFGNAVVCTQPKRGCAGSRCDGQVCRILHDPDVPPPHHYLATYRFLERVFGADLIVHVGTHGNLEFLPGKSVAPSGRCLPGAVLGGLPLLYIYNSDNPPEGTIAKRRAHAVLIDHLQTVMAPTSPYGVLKELEDRINEYRRFRETDRAMAHALEHQITDLISREKLAGELGIPSFPLPPERFEEAIEAAHRLISGIYSTRIPEGMHIFGSIPGGERRARFIATVLNHDGHVRALVSRLMGLDMRLSESETALIHVLDTCSEQLVAAILRGRPGESAAAEALGERCVAMDMKALMSLEDEVHGISRSLDLSDEIGSLVSGIQGRYISPGPSGLLSRGKTGILPTGRNFYSLDPASVPTPAAWLVGCRLADLMIGKYRDEHGRYPENVAILWMASDIMWADGEQFAQILSLIGAEPVWEHGRLTRIRIVPLERLNRPRIDVTVRVSGILRDCFFQCLEMLDDAIREVAGLNEPPDMNFLRRHDGGPHRSRIFGSPKGSYGTGVNLAVYASAWEETDDLSGIFIHWNGHAYGRGIYGEEAREALVSQLGTVEVTFNKTVTDEYDLLGCCCYFGSHGGMTAAARSVSGKEVTAYYGDTRNTDNVEVRTLADELRRVVRTKLLNPQYIDALKEHGYSGASELSRRTGRVFGWEATTGEVDDRIFDDIVRTFLLDDNNRAFFQEHNIWALEEMGRRLLEAHARGLWNADENILDGLKQVYLDIEGCLEEEQGLVTGNLQGGSIDVIQPDELKKWREEVRHIRNEKQEN